MPFNNFETRHFSATEKTAVQAALDALEIALENKTANLSPEERKQFGSIAEQNKLIVNKVSDYNKSQPNLGSPDVDWNEFASDYDSRNFIESILTRLESVMKGIGNAKILHDWDNFQAALTDYDFAKYKNSTTASGFETKVNELKQFFSKNSNKPNEIENQDEEFPLD